MLIYFQNPPIVPAPGFRDRSDIVSFETECQLAFDRLTLYAPGWALHGAQVGGRILMLPWDEGAIVGPPLTFQINGSPAEKIVIDLRAVFPTSQAAPYLMIRPVKVKAFTPFTPFAPRRRRGVRLVFDE